MLRPPSRARALAARALNTASLLGVCFLLGAASFVEVGGFNANTFCFKRFMPPRGARALTAGLETLPVSYVVGFVGSWFEFEA